MFAVFHFFITVVFDLQLVLSRIHKMVIHTMFSARLITIGLSFPRNYEQFYLLSIELHILTWLFIELNCLLKLARTNKIRNDLNLQRYNQSGPQLPARHIS